MSLIGRLPNNYRHTELQVQQSNYSSSSQDIRDMEATIARSHLAGVSSLSLMDMRAVHSADSLQRATSSTLTRSTSESSETRLLKDPFELRHGRRCLRSEVPYPLPCDLEELHRQSLRTLLDFQIFGGPICNAMQRQKPPKKVLELGCGGALWTAMCHDWYAARGHTDIQFVGLDVAPLPPNLRRQGIKWKFVQHDMRRVPLPFADNEFDLIMIKDCSTTMPLDPRSEKILIDLVRVLKPGGYMEIWESDFITRSLLNNTPPPRCRIPEHQQDADRSGTFAVPIGSPFAQTQNKYFQKANKWMEEIFEKRKLNPAPSTRIAEMLMSEPGFHDVNYRRVAIPFRELPWEKERARAARNGHDSPLSVNSADDTHGLESHSKLTPDQLALRHSALITVLGMIEALEPELKTASRMNAEEWSIWWACMMTDLLDPSNDSLSGECLEMGAWWATKAGDPDDSDLFEDSEEDKGPTSFLDL
ncbi:hypothetical protein CKM354_000131300 [Cercospora kikuchii]|uniref:Methyltransferase domain-containing protein n=1 Tax=Cercospora kikuchii TaxID=84275 RepID=A0A9P3C7S8_9PEZI|nr:uncharacterized protein CKM354_000131300 [Cercospora kikuchii]GIZ37883.1 hypothetical protein CKM354_000131300 [Cercospora kikuchii]